MAFPLFLNKKIPFAYALVLVLTLLTTTNTHADAVGKFKSIIAFGDSLTDTGNLPNFIAPPNDPRLANFLRLPYGETFFGKPTGRWSDGRLMIDFFASSFGIPFIPPFWGSSISTGNKSVTAAEFPHGINFAVAGATAMNIDFFDKYGVRIPFPNASLSYQLSWFKEYFLPVICANPQECKAYLEDALFLVGEIGGNDYNHAFFPNNKTVDVIRTFVPDIAKTIGAAVTELIQLGAKTLLVPGNFPLGCTSKFLTAFQTENKHDYDSSGCLKWPNELSQEHNKAVEAEVKKVQCQYPNATVIYADNYGASMRLYRDPTKYGFSELGGLYSCCGGQGPYNISLTVNCGNNGSYTCPDPNHYVCWDGLHFTDAGSKNIVQYLVDKCFSG